MRHYNHVCEDCGYEWEAAHPSDSKADAAKCSNCGSGNTQANRAG